ncbi:hypothetical protein O3P16_18905, partial [Chitinophagaceae bacterium LY-5]|nr:hypothetical protein [Chitinophagaceae bacterium LY-5]
MDYNYLDKPEKIYFGGRTDLNSITYTYDADGRKLKRSLSYSPTRSTTYIREYLYVGNFVYESDTRNAPGESLKFINTTEGQLRIITPVDDNNGYDAHVRTGNIETPGGTNGVFDYFISDFRADTRMILTEEVQYSLATASMETAGGRGTVEEGIFGNAGAGNEVATTRIANVSGIGWASNTSGYVSRLNSSKPVGPNQLLKVMGGDLISATTKYYYENPVVNTGTTSTIINTV